MKKAILCVLALTFGAGLVYAGSGDLIVIDKLGVGGVATPNYAVDIQGDVNVTGNFKIGGSPLVGAISGLRVFNDATSPNTKIDLTANSIGTFVLSGSIGIDCSTAGQAAGNDLDTGTLAADKWYYIWVIYNGSTVAGLASLSSLSSGLTLPSTYANSSQRLVGAVRTDGSVHFIPGQQVGDEFLYNSPITWASGSTVGWSWTVSALGNYVPPISMRALVGCILMLPQTPWNSVSIRAHGDTGAGIDLVRSYYNTSDTIGYA